MVRKVNYDFDLISSFVSISETSPTGIISNITGKPTGNFEKCSDGSKHYIRVLINKRRYMVHRVVWLLHYGSVDDRLVIDHIDGDSWNNSIHNLRLVEQSTNQRNRKKMNTNQTGYNGVGIHTTATGNRNGFNTYARATWVDINGKPAHKDFNIKNFETLEFATEFADLYRQLQIQDRETYTERHGK